MIHSGKLFWYFVLLVAVFGLVGCQADDPKDTPETAVAAYIDACAKGDLATAQTFFSAKTLQLIQAFGNNACGSDSDLEQLSQLSSSKVYETTTAGNTAYVEWELIWTEPAKTERYKYTLGQTDGQWFIIDVEQTYSETVVTEEREEVIQPNIITEESDDLLGGVAYVKTEGFEGSQTVIIETHIVNGQITERNVIPSEIHTPSQDTVIIVGVQRRAEVLASAQQFVQDYFTAYQNGEYADLVAKSFPDTVAGLDIAQANTTAQFRLLDFAVQSVSSLEVISAELPQSPYFTSSPSQNRQLPNNPYSSPIWLEAKLPLFVRYELFGIEQAEDITLSVFYQPDAGWFLSYWGVQIAAGQQPVKTGGGYEVQVEGLALIRGQAFVAINLLTPSPSDLSFSNVSLSDDVDGVVPSLISSFDYLPNSTIGYAWVEKGFNINAITVTAELQVNTGIFQPIHKVQIVVPVQ